MSRLNIERQKELEPKRMEYACKKITQKGYKVNVLNDNQLTFEFKGSTIRFYPYSGWATGKTIKDCRGINHLLKQLEKVNE